jgi:hypothetical protein
MAKDLNRDVLLSGNHFKTTMPNYTGKPASTSGSSYSVLSFEGLCVWLSLLGQQAGS